MLALRRAGDNDVRWLAASQGEQIDSHPARLSGQQEIDGSTLSWADLHGEVFVVTGPVLESECRRLVRVGCRCRPTITR
jgi:hypothetical protein